MKTILLCLATLWYSTAHADPLSFDCPHKIIATSTPKSTDAKWEAFVIENTAHRYLYAFLTAGHPTNQGQLKPSNAERADARDIDIYKLEGTDQTEYWIQCVYHNTTAGYAKRLPEGLKTCEFKNPKGPMTCN